MEIRAWIAVLGMLLIGCQSPQSESLEVFEAANSSGSIPAVPVQARANDHPRQLKLTLTLDQPSDLKVKAQDQVIQGQVLSDRTSQREALHRQRDRLRLQLNQLRRPVIPQTTATEVAKVEAARIALIEAQQAIAAHQQNSPWTDYAHQVLPLEYVSQLDQLEQQVELAKADLAIAEGQLQDAKQPSPVDSVQDLQQESDLLRQLLAIEEQLKDLGVVKSPYMGTIKSIKWVGQSDHELQVVVTLLTGADSLPVTPSLDDASLWTVLSIHDGDTIKVRRGEQEERIRFACIDAPELEQPLGAASADYLRSLLAGGQVKLAMIERDRFGRQIAEVYLPSGQLVQQLQVSAGMVYLYQKYISSCPSADVVRSAQEQAKAQKIGVWSGEYQTPWDYRQSIKK